MIYYILQKKMVEIKLALGNLLFNSFTRTWLVVIKYCHYSFLYVATVLAFIGVIYFTTDYPGADLALKLIKDDA